MTDFQFDQLHTALYGIGVVVIFALGYLAGDRQ